MTVHVKTASAFFVTFVLLALVSVNHSDDPSEKCTSKYWDRLMKSCNFITAELKDSFWTCVKEMNITVPCMIANGIDAKPWNKCAEDTENIHMSRKFYEVDWADCALNKLGVIVVNKSPVTFDVNKVVAIVQKMDVMRSVPVEDYKEDIARCNSLKQEGYVPDPSTTPEMVLKREHDGILTCVFKNAVSDRLFECFKPVCKELGV